jgi:hypothetical protein
LGFLPQLDELREEWTYAKSALAMDSDMTFEEKIELAQSLGNPHVNKGMFEFPEIVHDR